MSYPADIRETALAVCDKMAERGKDFGWEFDVIARAILAERERCAQVAERFIDVWDEQEHAAHAIRKLHGVEIASAIRKGAS